MGYDDAMLARTLNQKPLIGANFLPRPKSARDRAVERWFLREKPLLRSTTTSDKTLPGQYYDAETNLHYNWNRYYDPQLGKYITSDPIGALAGMNTYNYSAMNPVKHYDPLGLFCVPLPSKKNPWKEYWRAKKDHVSFNGAFFSNVSGAIGVCKFTKTRSIKEKRTVQKRELCFECTLPNECLLPSCEFYIKDGGVEEETRSNDEVREDHTRAIRFNANGYSIQKGNKTSCQNPYTGETLRGPVR